MRNNIAYLLIAEVGVTAAQGSKGIKFTNEDLG